MSDAVGVLGRIALEIRYERGLVYFDRCGSLLEGVAELLGSAFRYTIPTQEHAELTNDVERLVVRFSPKSVVVAQTGPNTVARVEKTAATVWDLVSKTLEVGSRVTRFGVRLTYFWPQPSLRAAQGRLAAVGLTMPGPVWVEAFGIPSFSSVTSVTLGDRGSHVRRAVDAIEHVIDGVLHPDSKPFVPEAAIQLDIDYAHPTMKTISQKHVREFVRACWENFQEDLQKMQVRLSNTSEAQS